MKLAGDFIIHGRPDGGRGRAPVAMQTNDAAAAIESADRSQQLRLVALAVLTAALLGLCTLLAVPFLPAITWGVALAIMAWPIHRWVSRHVSRPTLAAALSSLAVILLILVPGFFVTYHLALEAGVAADHVQDSGDGTLRQRMAQVPAFRPVIAWMERVDLDVEEEIRKMVRAYTGDISSLAQGSVTAMIQFLVALFILFHLFRDRGAFTYGLRNLLPLSRAESDKVFARAADSVHANLYATMITSLIDATGGAIMFWLLGLPAPVLWGVVVFVLSVLPVVGAGLVWAPAALYLFLAGQWPQGLALLAWGFASFWVVDNIIYVRLAGERMRMHEVPAMIAFLGGLAVFGISGMILGPAIVAVTVALIEVWRRRDDNAELATPPAVLP